MTNSSFNPDIVDTRNLFRIYASLAALAGVLLWVTGSQGVMTDPGATTDESRAWLQFAGAMLAAVGCAAAGSTTRVAATALSAASRSRT
jgi:hypothetical protein